MSPSSPVSPAAASGGAGGMTNGRLLGRVLRAAGVEATYGAPLAGVAVVPVPSNRVAALMAEAHRRVHLRPAAVHHGDGMLVIGGDIGSDPAGSAAPLSGGSLTGSSGGAPAGSSDGSPAGSSGGAPAVGPFTGAPSAGSPVVVSSADDLLDLVDAVRTAARAGPGGGGAGLAVRLALDLDAPAPDVLPPSPAPIDRWIEPDDDLVAALAAARRPVMLAGPGLVWAGAVPGLHAAATAANLGVLNTWGAKGVFDWRSRHHLATVGLQARDFELGGLAEADLVVTTGLDPAEAPAHRWQGAAPVVGVPPGALDPLAARWWRPQGDIAVPPLRAGLARVTQEGWASTTTPLAPSLVTRHYGQVCGAGGVVAADPGIAGYWVARTFATTELGGAQVPAARGAHGFAVACALVARLRSPNRPVLAVVDEPMPEIVHEALDVAARLGVAVPVEVWGADGESLPPDGHLARLRSLVSADHSRPVGLEADGAQLGRMIDVAGDVVAWRS